MRILGVARETVETVGVVSADCARQMAAGARRISGAGAGAYLPQAWRAPTAEQLKRR